MLVRITFPNRATERKALSLLLGRFSGTVLKDGVHVIPSRALPFLANHNLAFTVEGTAPAPRRRRPRTIDELLELPPKRRERILRAAAEEARHEYLANPDLNLELSS
jgi:hypothetical protein